MRQRTPVSRRLGELRWLAVALTLHLPLLFLTLIAPPPAKPKATWQIGVVGWALEDGSSKWTFC